MTGKDLLSVFVSANEMDSNMEPANVVDGLFAIARAMDRIANSIDSLGLNNASTPKGAVELLAEEVKIGLDRVAVSIGAGLSEIADAREPVERP